MLERLNQERDAVIYQLQGAISMENYTEVACLIGKLTQIQDIIFTLREEQQ